MSTPKVFVIEFVSGRKQPVFRLESNNDIEYCRQHPSEYTVRETLPSEWRKRELIRSRQNIYQSTPHWFPNWLHRDDHFVHVSSENPLMLAYTPDEAKGEADRQVRIKPGKYLQKYYGDDLTAGEIRDFATRWSAEFKPDELLFASTEDDFERVYTTGPNSCMAKSSAFFTDPVHFNIPYHPVRLYAAGDLQLAYIEREGRITARALVWPERKVVGRIYGDRERLSKVLTQAGYTLSREGDNAFDGARLQRHEHGNGFLMPYVDWHPKCRIDGEFLIIDRHGELSAQTTNGTTNTDWWCPTMESWAHPHTFQRVMIDYESERSELWSDMRVQRDAFLCSYSHNYFPNDQKVELNDGQGVSRFHFEYNGAKCSGNEGAYLLYSGRIFGDRFYSFDYIETLLPQPQDERLAA